MHDRGAHRLGELAYAMVTPSVAHTGVRKCDVSDHAPAKERA